jgi:hypothetical protein
LASQCDDRSVAMPTDDKLYRFGTIRSEEPKTTKIAVSN